MPLWSVDQGGLSIKVLVNRLTEGQEVHVPNPKMNEIVSTCKNSSIGQFLDLIQTSSIDDNCLFVSIERLMSSIIIQLWMFLSIHCIPFLCCC